MRFHESISVFAVSSKENCPIPSPLYIPQSEVAELLVDFASVSIMCDK